MSSAPQPASQAVLIHGASGGIGSALARRLSAAGTDVALGGPDADRLGALAAETGGLPVTLDATRTAEVETALKASAALHALGRVGEPDEVAGAIAWLLDAGQSWITGQVLGVDGGLASVRSRG